MGNNIWITLGMVVLLFVVFYFFVIRPQKKQEKEAADMRNALTVGDEITTIGGKNRKLKRRNHDYRDRA